jgi:SAM-dependent methyltransferase
VMGYRERIYGRYVSAFKGAPPPDNAKARRRRFEVFDHLLRPVLRQAGGPPRSVLEVGCGPGNFLEWALARDLSPVGIDLSAEQVEVARARGLPAERAAAQDYLPRHDSAFDLIVAQDVLEHLTRDEAFAFLDAARAALRPGGSLFLTTPNAAAWRPGPVAYGDLTHETLFTPQTLDLALRLCGFGPARIAEVTPPPTTPIRAARLVLWRILRLAPLALDLVEQGAFKVHILTRVMAAWARRP